MSFVDEPAASIVVPAPQPPDATRVLLSTGKLVGEGFDHPAMLRMWDKRQRGYRAMGYKVGSDVPAE